MASNSSIDEIKNVSNIVDVIGEVVPLKRAGSNFKGCCPFHSEKTPSFVVSETKQIFTCFGCGASGDVIEFVKRYYNLDFKEAVEKLGAKYNIKVEFKSNSNSREFEHFYEINREAAAFFMRALFTPGNPGMEYAKSRNILPETIKAFGLGYADGGGTTLLQHLRSKGYSEKDLLKLGLISERNGKYADKFRNRLMFPIINTSGKVIGFGGRIIGDGEPKYMNSPESPIFLKKNNLFGLNLTRQSIGKEDQAIIVEGNMDVVSLYQSGVHNVCATCGTALTESQSKLLARYTKNVVLSYDADDAGRKAALRGIEILHGAGSKVKVLHVTDGKDPDDYVKSHGAAAFKELVKNASSYADYRIDDLKRRFDVESEEGRIEFFKEVAKILAVLSPTEQDIYTKKISAQMDISEGALRLETKDMKARDAEKPKPVRKNASEDEHLEISKLERQLLKILLIAPGYYPQIAARKNAFESSAALSILDAIKKQRDENPHLEAFDENRILDSLDENCSAALNEIIENEPIGGNVETVMQQCFNTIERNALEIREKELLDRLELAGGMEDEGSLQNEILEELQYTRNMITQLRK